MNELLMLASAALLAGLTGSVHCLGMCGGLSSLYAAHQAARDCSTSVSRALAYNAGRLLTYSALGAAAGFAGQGLVARLPAMGGPLRIMAGVLIVFAGLRVLTGIRWLGILERLGTHVWMLIKPLARPAIPADTSGKALALGLFWGLLPCGMLYAVIAVSAATTSPAYGAITMLAFGLGTLPAMLATGIGGFRLSSLLNGNRRATGGLLVAIGVLTLVTPTVGLIGGAGHAQGNGHAGHAPAVTPASEHHQH